MDKKRPGLSGSEREGKLVGGVALARQAGLFGALDLGDLTVVDDDLDHAVAQRFNLLADDGKPGG